MRDAAHLDVCCYRGVARLLSVLLNGIVAGPCLVYSSWNVWTLLRQHMKEREVGRFTNMRHVDNSTNHLPAGGGMLKRVRTSCLLPEQIGTAGRRRCVSLTASSNTLVEAFGPGGT